jgi:hypothetical protein
VQRCFISNSKESVAWFGLNAHGGALRAVPHATLDWS